MTQPTMPNRRATLALLAILPIAACGRRRADPAPAPTGGTPAMRALVDRYAAISQVPPSLMHRVVQRESGYNASARNGPYWGLMQILPETARTMGHRGSPDSLLDPATNLTYAGRYLRGAWMVSDGDQDQAVRWYSQGYYYEAKRRGLLRETGLRS